MNDVLFKKREIVLEKLKYHTRDGEGNDIIKEVKVKEFPIYDIDFLCPICHKEHKKGCKIKDIVSGSFTDWTYLGEYVCPECSKLFSLYFYNYIVDQDGIRLLNVRELRDKLTRKQKPPFMFAITTSQKKHLFYGAPWNENPEYFGVKLERETIWTTPERMRELFDFVECFQTLGAGKEMMKCGMLPYTVLGKYKISLWATIYWKKVRCHNRQICKAKSFDDVRRGTLTCGHWRARKCPRARSGSICGYWKKEKQF